jgi:membrane-bound serine protease (ClpP class)
MVGERGEALTAFGPREPGQMRVHGEIWRAVSDRPVLPGQHLKVVGAAGLTLHVQPWDPVDSNGGLR